MRHNSYDIVVIGAGLLGCSVALHLMRRGATSVALVDKVPPAAATTGAGAGFVGAWAAGYAAPGTCDINELNLENYGIDFYTDLAERNDIQIRRNGNLFLARTEQGWDTHIAAIADHPLAPAGTRSLSGAQVEQISGGALAASGIYRAVLHPAGIQIDTTPTVTAMVAELIGRGADLLIGESADHLLQTDRVVTGIGTDAGPIHSRTTVLAAGAWTNDLLEGVGVTLPIAREVASRVISPPCGIGPHMPTIMVPEMAWLWAREHQGAMTYGNVTGYELSHTLGAPTPVGQRPHADSLIHTMYQHLWPELSTLFPNLDPRIAQWRQGVVSHTPDRLFYAGQVPGVDGLYALAGCNEGGVTHGPGLGRVLADIILDGESDFVDASRYRLDRFQGRHYQDEAAVAAALPAFERHEVPTAAV